MSLRRQFFAGLMQVTGGGSTTPPPPAALLPYPTRNLLMQLDTQQTPAQNYADNGRTWLDLSGNGNHARVPDGWTTPALVTDPANGLPALLPVTGGNSGFKTRLNLGTAAFLFCVVNVRTVNDSASYAMLWDEVDGNYRYGVYLNDSIFKIAKGGGYGNYAVQGAGLRTLSWDGLLLADNNTDFVGTGIGNPYQVANGLTIGNSAAGGSTADAFYHLVMLFSQRPTDDEIQQLVDAAQSNFQIPHATI